MSPRRAVRLSVIIVTYNRREALRRTLPALTEQLDQGDELVVVDNASSDGTLDLVDELAPGAIVIRNRSNEGFAAGCNSGALAATGDLLVMLDSDATPAPGFCAAIRRPLSEGRGWTAWVGLITAEGGRIVNSSGGVIHFTGIAWAGDSGRPVETAPTAPREVPFAPGTCRAVPREIWLREGGLDPAYFIYHEDVDFSLRLRLGGGEVWLEPAARVDHAYEFIRQAKWRQLERNRWATVVRTYPGVLLFLLAPVLVVTELVLVPISIAGGWGPAKLGATLDTLRALPRLRRERRAIQARRRIDAAEFASWLVPNLSSPYLESAGRIRALQAALRAYWAVVLLLLRAARHLGVR